ncbi:MAG: hypothetical protein ACKPKO_02860, partial [Candidatus Fonsibacter sp.]
MRNIRWALSPPSRLTGREIYTLRTKDQYTTELLYRLPPEAIEDIARMLEDIEKWVMRPVSVMINLVVFLEKPAGGDRP